MITYKQTGRTIIAVIDGKPFTVTAKSKEELDVIKEDLSKIDATKSEKVKKTLTNKLMKLFKPKEEQSKKEKDKEIDKIIAEKKKEKKKVVEGKKKGATTTKKQEAVANIVNAVAKTTEEKVETAIEVAKTVETKPAIHGSSRRGEY